MHESATPARTVKDCANTLGAGKARHHPLAESRQAPGQTRLQRGLVMCCFTQCWPSVAIGRGVNRIDWLVSRLTRSMTWIWMSLATALVMHCTPIALYQLCTIRL